MKKVILVFVVLAGLLVVGFGVLQLIPFGKNHTNPPVVSEPKWDSPMTRQVAKRACFDCHSNETVWPWYSNIAPVSWLVQKDVNEGRQRMNLSEWDKYSKRISADEVAEVIAEGEMPKPIYLIQHPEARLSDKEKQLFIKGMSASLR